MNAHFIYKISNHYRKVTVWEGSPTTRERCMLRTMTPGKALNKKERHGQICRWLRWNYGIAGPAYNSTH